MRRALAQPHIARHSFRASLPQGSLAPLADSTWRLGADDLRHFLMAYCACFMAVSAFVL